MFYNVPVKTALALALLMSLAPAPCRAARWWWNNVPSRWADKPKTLDASEKGWYGDDLFDDAGLNFRAMNDASQLYLLVMADGRDGRAVLSGAFRQDVTLWFCGADKKRAFGVRLPFSRLGPLDLAAVDEIVSLGSAPALPKVEPELVIPNGAEISTAALTSDIEVLAGLSGKNPLVELRLPLAKAAPAGAKRALFDFTTAKVDPELELQLRSLAPRRPRGEGPERPRRRGGEMDLSEASRPDRVSAPAPLNLQLRLRPAKAPER